MGWANRWLLVACSTTLRHRPPIERGIPLTLPILAGSYGIDTMHTQLGFSVKHLGISTVHGTFDAFTGSLVVGASLADTTVSLDADMTSVNSGNDMRDKHLHGADFFDTEDHPQLTFRSTSIVEHGDGYALNGELTIKGVAQPVTLTASFNGSSVFPMDKSTHFGFSASGQISRSAFGVSYGIPMVSDEVTLRLDAQFVSPAAS